MISRPLLAGLCLALLAPACLTASGRRASDLDRLADYMTGTFSSQAQSLSDTSYWHAQMSSARIWTERRDGVWLYLEQAMASSLERPYRQRVYHLHHKDGRIASDVYRLPGEVTDFIGAYQDPARFAGLTPGDLVPLPGCTVWLEPFGSESFRGGTEGTGCANTLEGAAYAQSIVEFTANQALTWDRGFNMKGEQVWGAKEGPYIFDKQ